MKRWLILPRRLPWRRHQAVPLVLQMEAVECGAACLAMVLASHGRHVSLEELREACGVSRDGSNALAIVRAARTYGMISQGAKVELDAFAAMHAPCIVFWEFNHFIVVEHVGRDRFHVNDPALGRRVLTRDEFSAGFTGVLLSFHPGPEFRRGGRQPRILSALLRKLGSLSVPFGFVVLATLLLVVPGLLVPIFSKVFVDQILIARQTDWTRPLLVLFGVTAVFSLLLTWMQQFFLLRLETLLTIDAGSRMVWRLFTLPLSYFAQRAAGDVIGRVQANGRVSQVVSGALPGNLVGLLTLAFYAVLMVCYDALLAAMVVGITALNAFAMRWISRTTANSSQLLAQTSAVQLSAVVGGLSTIETVKAAGLEGSLLTRWLGHQARFINLSQQIGQRNQLLGLIPSFLSTAVGLVVVGYGSVLVLRGRITVGDLIAFQALAASFSGPVAALVALSGQLQATAADMRRIDDVMRYPVPMPAHPERTLDAGKLARIIRHG